MVKSYDGSIADDAERSKQKKVLRELVKPIIFNVLPAKMPYKIGTHKDVLAFILPQFPGSKTQLRRIIDHVLFARCKSIAYLQATINGHVRHGIDGRTYGISAESKLIAKQRLAAIKPPKKGKKWKKKNLKSG